jgi:hypothetical protein
MEFVPAPFHDDDSDVHNVQTLSVLGAARRAGVTQSAILRWIRNGYLQATPSSNGWQIPAHLLDDAQRAADAGRGTGPVPRRASPTLEPSPTPIRRSMETRAVEIPTAMPSGLETIGESVVAPLAELIRDQIDVVHDQAEVIGWLQAERARLRQEVEVLKSLEHQVDTAQAEVQQKPADTSPEEDDALVSLLWRDSAHAAEEIDGLEDFASDETIAAISDAELLPQQEPEAASTDFDDWFTDQVVTVDAPDPVEERPELRLEDYADPSWFFVQNDFSNFNGGSEARRAPTLKPIVPRQKAVAESEEDSYLRQMIDETERKIAQLWRNEEELRQSRPVGGTGTRREVELEGDRGSIWQRLWPTRR